MKTFINVLRKPFVILMLATLFLTLGSAKWTVAFGPWLGYAFLLYYVRNTKLWPGIGWAYLVLLIGTLIGAYEVIPAPMPIFPVIAVVISLKMMLPFLVDHFTQARDKGFMGKLIFPV